MNNESNSTPTDINAELAKLRAENEKLRAANEKRQTLTLKVSDKGACSLYGMGRFPITLYAQQWEKVFAHQDMIKAFLEANKSRLTTKE